MAYENQLSFVDGFTDKQNNCNKLNDTAFEVVQFKFLESKFSNYDEVFSGYNELRVITYSYGLTFIEEIMKYFDYGQVIIGDDKLINSDAAELLLLQETATNLVCKNRYLQKRIQSDQFRFFVLGDLVSHQKIYLLKSDQGKVKTILGSANFSKRAWDGDQIESILVCEEENCYYHYLAKYENLLEFSTDEITKDAIPIREDGSNIDELPICKRVKYDKAIVINASQNKEEIEFSLDINKKREQWKNRIKSVNLKTHTDGKIHIDAKKISTIVKNIKETNAKKTQEEKKYAQFEIDFDNHTAMFNQRELNLSPDKNAVKSNIENLITFMNGYDKFSNDTKFMKEQYWKVVTYKFISPFLAYLRYQANKYEYEDRYFPIYLLLNGGSDAGKTSFIKFIQKLMFNKNFKTMHQSWFSKNKMDILKETVTGIPILIDEMTNTYWRYAPDNVKNDSILIEEKKINHPTFIILSNDIAAIKPEVSKRVILMNIDNRINRNEAASNSKSISLIRKKISNEFYCEYVNRVFDKIEILVTEMKINDEKNNGKWNPDIFELSSNLIIEIMNELEIPIPEELRTFKWVDYLGDDALSKKAFEIITDEYYNNFNSFKIKKYKNKKAELTIDFSHYETKEGTKIVETLIRELPADTECKRIDKKVIMNLNVIEQYTNLNFKKKWWRRE